MIQKLNGLPRDIFGYSPRDSILWLRGGIPNGEDEFGISFDGKESIVPFAPYLFILNSDKKGGVSFVDWVMEGGLEKINRFAYRRDLTLALKKGDDISIFLSPILNRKILDAERVCIPFHSILSYTVY